MTEPSKESSDVIYSYHGSKNPLVPPEKRKVNFETMRMTEFLPCRNSEHGYVRRDTILEFLPAGKTMTTEIMDLDDEAALRVWEQTRGRSPKFQYSLRILDEPFSFYRKPQQVTGKVCHPYIFFP